MSDTADTAAPLATGTIDTSPALSNVEQSRFDAAVAMMQSPDEAEPVAHEEAPTPAANKVEPTAPAPTAAEAQIERNMANLRREQSKLESQRAEYKAIAEENKRFKAQIEAAKFNPKSVPTLLGLEEAEYTQRLLNGQGDSPAEKMAYEMRQELNELKASRAAELQQAQEREQAAIATDNHRQASHYVQNSPDHELTRAFDASAAVVEEVQRHYADTYDAKTGQGKILSWKEAADVVEKRFETEVQKRFGNVNKLKNLFGAQAAPKATNKPVASGRTLTANMTGATSSANMSDAERYNAALKLLTAK